MSSFHGCDNSDHGCDSFHHEHNAAHFQVFSPYGPFKQTHHSRPQCAVVHESHQLHTYQLDREGASSNNSEHRRTTCTPSVHPAQSVGLGCNCKKVCYHVQQMLCATAVMTGLALIIVGAIQNVQTGEGEHDVLLYIGVLLMAVGCVLLFHQWDVQRKIKRRRMRNMTIVHSAPNAEETAVQSNTHPLLDDPNHIMIRAGSNSYQPPVETSPSDIRSIISHQHPLAAHRHDRHHHHHHSSQHSKSHSNHQLPRYDVYSSQAIGGYHDLAHSVPLQDKV